LKQLFKNQIAFIIPMGLYLLIGCFLLAFEIEKGDLVLFFSDNRSESLNQFFIIVNELGEEYIYVLGLVVLLFVKFRYALIMPLVAGLTAVLSLLLKNAFGHARPKLWFESMGVALNYVPDVFVNGGAFSSFPSGHTFSAFAAFGYFALVSKSPFLKVAFCLLAMLGGLARVYLAQHFFEDIIFGGFCGITLAVLLYILQLQLNNDENRWWNKRLTLKIKTE